LKIVVATRNRHKLREIRALLETTGHDFVAIDEVAPHCALVEDGATFEANALAKARQANEATGLPAIGDDSGLEVAALGGEPGVRSARYAGEPSDDEANNSKLIAEMNNVPRESRQARFVCAAAFVNGHPGAEIVTRGVCEGVILEHGRGTGGFGYDPLFLVDDKTMAELSPERKNGISHRARAFGALAAVLGATLPGRENP